MHYDFSWNSMELFSLMITQPFKQKYFSMVTIYIIEHDSHSCYVQLVTFLIEKLFLRKKLLN